MKCNLRRPCHGPQIDNTEYGIPSKDSGSHSPKGRSGCGVAVGSQSTQCCKMNNETTLAREKTVCKHAL